MIMKNGAPNHTVTTITQNRAQSVSPSQKMLCMPRCSRSQLKAL